jgi:hypothetical protein
VSLKTIDCPIDINFVKNLGLQDLPQGYGAYQSNLEIDSLVNKQDSLTDKELKKTQAKE